MNGRLDPAAVNWSSGVYSGWSCRLHNYQEFSHACFSIAFFFFFLSICSEVLKKTSSKCYLIFKVETIIVFNTKLWYLLFTQLLKLQY